MIFVHNSGNRCDRTVRFAALCIVFRCAYDEMEKLKKTGDKNVSTFTAGSKNNVIFVHNSGNRYDRTVRFAALCIVFRCAYDEMEK